jgi:hypothetical protein
MGWTAYPETAGWDILLVREDGLQIGVQAKLRLNAKVFDQCLDGLAHWRESGVGPDHRAVLIPHDIKLGDWEKIATFIGVTIIRSGRGSPLPPINGVGSYIDDAGLGWFDWCPESRHTLPSYIPDVIAGAPSPTQLTEWKIKAIKIAITLERRGYVSRKDFKHHKISITRWIVPGHQWVISKERNVLVRGPKLPDFKAQHPSVWDQIWNDYDTWLPKE